MNSYIETEGVIDMRRRTVRLDREGDYWTDEEKQKLVHTDSLLKCLINPD